jgi:hypothetical protein
MPGCAAHREGSRSEILVGKQGGQEVHAHPHRDGACDGGLGSARLFREVQRHLARTPGFPGSVRQMLNLSPAERLALLELA